MERIKSSSKILALGDPHFKSDNLYQTNIMCANFLNLVKEVLEEIDAVVIMGDILHNHDKINIFCLNRAILFLQNLRQILDEAKSGDKKELWVLIGNHDRPNKYYYSNTDHAFNALKEWNNTFVADTLIIREIRGGFKFALAPYVAPGKFGEMTKEYLDGGDITCVFAHQEFYGASLRTSETGENGAVVLKKSQEGDVYSKTAPFCVSGHIHEEQWVGKNVYYLGSPYKLGWCSHYAKDENKKDAQKGAVLFTFYNTPINKREIVKYPLNVPLNKTVVISSKDILMFKLDEISNRYQQDGSKTRVFIRCQNTQEELLVMEHISKYKHDFVKFFIEKRFDEDEENSVKTNFTFSPISMNFCERMKQECSNLSDKAKEYLYELFPNMK